LFCIAYSDNALLVSTRFCVHHLARESGRRAYSLPASGYILRETKASEFRLKPDKIKPGKPEEHHLDDVAIQASIYQATGLPLAGAELSLLNSRWRFPGNNDYSGLFRRLSVIAEIAGRVPEVPNCMLRRSASWRAPCRTFKQATNAKTPTPALSMITAQHWTYRDPSIRSPCYPASAGKTSRRN
jgi:hypothetical protein